MAIKAVLMEKKVRRVQLASGQEIIEGVHFYVEKGYYVFTEQYLLERGYCCQSGCRHCPYGFKKQA
jgi:hypothetical protein